MNLFLDCRENISKKYIRNYIENCDFELFTGADLIISPWSRLPTIKTIDEHLNRGAMMIQIKHGNDLVSSIYDGRLKEARNRMSAFDCDPHQRGLLITGNFNIIAGNIAVNNQRTGCTEASYQGAIVAWSLSNSAIYICPSVEKLSKFIDLIINQKFNKIEKEITPKKKTPKTNIVVGLNNMTFSEARKKISNRQSEFFKFLISIEGISISAADKITSCGVTDIISFSNMVIAGGLLDIAGIGPKKNERIKQILGLERK